MTEPSAVAPEVEVYFTDILKQMNARITEMLLGSGATALGSVAGSLN